MHILLGILGLATAGYFLVMRARRGAEVATELLDVASDVRAAARRFGFRRKFDVHPVDSVEDIRLLIGGLGSAFISLDDLPTSDSRAALDKGLRKHLDLDATEAEEIAILGQWLVSECGGAQPAVARMSKRLRKLDGDAKGFDVLMGAIQAIAQAQTHGVSQRQKDALDDIKSAYRLV